jgi:hypothetical protein
MSSDGTFVVSGDDAQLFIWDPRTGDELAAYWALIKGVYALAVHPDNGSLVLAGGDQTVRIWDARSGGERAVMNGHTGGVWAAAVSPDGTFVVSGGADQTVRVWDARTGDERTVINGHNGEVTAVAVTPDGSLIVSASYDGTMKLWDSAAREAVAALPLPAAPHGLALHPWRPLAACGDDSGRVNLIELVGVEYGPIFVTAFDQGRGAQVRCPACLQEFSVAENRLGRAISCTMAGCGLGLQLNPFITRPARWPGRETRTRWDRFRRPAFRLPGKGSPHAE